MPLIVNALIAGTQKGGTTALAEFLSEHPQIGMPDIKELHFFRKDEYFRRRPVDYGAYHEHFFHADEFRILCDATPIYMYWKSAAGRIREYNPRMKLVFLLRHPVERAYSHWQMIVKWGMEPWSFSKAIRWEAVRRVRAFPKQSVYFSYVDRGFYHRQIVRMLRYFPMEQMLFLKNEELRDSHPETIGRICDFLGVDRMKETEARTVFSNEYAPMTGSDRTYLLRKYAKDTAALEKLLGWDCAAWKE